MAKTDSRAKKFNFRETMLDQLKELAEEKGISETQVMENAFELYYSQDVMPEHIVLGRMTQLQQQLTVVDRKLETLAGICYSVLPYIFATLPPLPASTTDKDGTKHNLALERGIEIMQAHVRRYKQDMRKTKISFMQNVWADMQEELNMTNLNAFGMAMDERTAGN